MKILGIKEAMVYKLRAIFFCVWTLEGLVEKKTKFGSGKNLGR